MKYFALFLWFVYSSLAFADEIPFRKAGLWEIEIIKNDEPAMTMKECVDVAFEKETSELRKSLTKDMCSKNETRKEGDTFISETDCTMASERSKTNILITGDFTSQYKSVVTVQTVAEDGEETGSNIVLNAQWIGECEPGQQPGQMIMSEGD